VVPAMWEAIGRSISLGLAKAKMWDLTWIITKSKRAGNMYQLESACLASIKPVFKPSTISYTHTHTHTHTHTQTKILSQAQWFMPVILASWKAEIVGSQFETTWAKKVSKTPSQTWHSGTYM
jgi:hypothetical protein